MILTDREIQAALNNGQISIEPVPSVDAYSSTSVDLKLAPSVRVWSAAALAGVEPTIISPSDAGFDFKQVVERLAQQHTIPEAGRVIQPNEFLLGWTEEVVDLRSASRIAARVEGKSSLARLGIGVHVTAPTIHAGFAGPIQLEICNHGSLPVRLKPGMRICQLIFEQTLGTPEKGYSGQFQRQVRG